MYSVEKKDDFVIVRIFKNRAEIEFNNIMNLKNILEDLLSKGEKKILIDFKNVIYIDSSGLGILMETMKKLKEGGGELGILSISRDLLEVFTATKIGQFFKYYKTIS